MTTRFEVGRLTWSIVGAVSVLVAMLLVGLWLSYRQEVDSRHVVHSVEVENQLSTVLSHLQDAETGSRGFNVTGQPEFLEPYQNARAHLDADLNRLRAMTADNPRQRRAVTQLSTLAAEMMPQIAKHVAMGRSGISGDAPLIASMRESKRTMDALRQQIQGMRAEQERLLVIRQARSDATFGSMRLVILAGLLVVGVTTSLGLRANARHLAMIVQNRDELARVNAELVAGMRRSEEAEAQVRQMQKIQAVGQLTGGIAHDFNNMLSIVIGSLDLARRRLRTEPDRAEAGIDNALAGAQKAATLTGRLLAFSRQQALNPIVVDPNSLVAGMSELLRRTIGEQVRVETTLTDGVWRTHVDVSQLENAILNLCVNARDSMTDGGRLTIETSNAHLDEEYARLNADVTPGGYVLISVSDSGIGMSPEIIARAFDPYFTTKGVGQGTGLGLSQVFGFMRQSDGHVKIYSEPGIGTWVRLYLPRWIGDDATESKPIAPPAASVDTHSEVILVVEDEPGVRIVSVDGLRHLGYDVIHASSAEEALRMMALQPRIDLLFTDIVMEGANGRELAEKATERLPNLKVLYTTGYGRNAVVHNGILDVGVELLPKPFTLTQLATKVRQVLDGA